MAEVVLLQVQNTNSTSPNDTGTSFNQFCPHDEDIGINFSLMHLFIISRQMMQFSAHDNLIIVILNWHLINI